MKKPAGVPADYAETVILFLQSAKARNETPKPAWIKACGAMTRARCASGTLEPAPVLGLRGFEVR